MKKKSSFLVKTLLKSVLLTLLLVGTTQGQAAFESQKVAFDQAWTFYKIDTDNPADIPLNGGEMVHIPHTWNQQDALDDTPGFYRGSGWYRYQFTINQTEQTVDYLHIGAASMQAWVYVNGQLVSQHQGGYTAFVCNLQNKLHNGQNDLLIRVSNAPDATLAPISADFTFFGGLTRSVYLYRVPKTHISFGQFGARAVHVTYREVLQKKAFIDVETKVQGDQSKVAVTQHLLDRQGVVCAQSRYRVKESHAWAMTVPQTLSIKKPVLWSPDNPYMYSLITEVIAENGRVIDAVQSPVAFRTAAVSGEHGFLLNGQPYKLNGVNRHEMWLGQGSALQKEQTQADMAAIKAMGANFIRIAHYPQDEAVLQACDQLGIIALVEIPVVNEITESDAFLASSVQQMHEMIAQCEIHPSVVGWAFMNEVLLRLPYKKEPEKQEKYLLEVQRQAKILNETAKKDDPSRFTLLPCHGDFGLYEKAGLLTITDAIGWNLYQGWYKGKTEELGSFLDKFHQKFPNQSVWLSEYGADMDPRLYSEQPQRFDYTPQYGLQWHQQVMAQLDQRTYLGGTAVWNYNDFYSEYRQHATPHINSKGLVTLDRKPKEVAQWYRCHWSKTPYIAIGRKAHPSIVVRGNQFPLTIQVPVFTNANRIQWFLNEDKQPELEVNNQMAMLPIQLGKPVESIHIKVITTDGNAHDQADWSLSYVTNEEFTFQKPLGFLLGTDRDYFQASTGIWWVHEPNPNEFNWGSRGGSALVFQTKNGALPASDLALNNTEDDPIYQTQRKGICEFSVPLKAGKYRIHLLGSQLEVNQKKEGLVNQLGTQVSHESALPIGMTIQYGATTIGTFCPPQAPESQDYQFEIDHKGGIVTLHFTPLPQCESAINALLIEPVQPQK